MTGRATATSDGPYRPTERLADPQGVDAERTLPPTIKLAARPLGVLQADQEGQAASPAAPPTEGTATPGSERTDEAGPMTALDPIAEAPATATPALRTVDGVRPVAGPGPMTGPESAPGCEPISGPEIMPESGLVTVALPAAGLDSATSAPRPIDMPTARATAASTAADEATTSSATDDNATATADNDTATDDEATTSSATDDNATATADSDDRLRVVAPAEPIATKLCAEQHPNDPESPVCRICDQPFANAEQVLAMAPTTVARLLLEDGTAVDVSDALTIGRSPADGGHGDTLTVTGRQVSRHHLSVEARGWQLFVQDCDSTNGTFLTRRGEKGRRRVPIDRAIPVRIGDSIHFGSRQALVVQARSG